MPARVAQRSSLSHVLPLSQPLQRSCLLSAVMAVDGTKSPMPDVDDIHFPDGDDKAAVDACKDHVVSVDHSSESVFAGKLGLYA